MRGRLGERGVMSCYGQVYRYTISVPFSHKNAYLIVLVFVHPYKSIHGSSVQSQGSWHLLSPMHLNLEAAQYSQSSSFIQ